jgi:hypothetical protein
VARQGLKLTDAELRATVDAYLAHGGNQTKAGQALGLGQGLMWQRLQTARKRGILTPDVEAQAKSRESFTTGRRLPQTADECWSLLDDFIGRSRKPPRTPHRQVGKTCTSRIVIASDFHAPFMDPWAVGELIAREGGKTHTLIVNGDLQDFYAISRFI